jgi:hypothetical protein
MRNPKMRVYAENGSYGLDIYLDISGKKCFLIKHRRSNGLMYQMLKDGMSIAELRKVKPFKTVQRGNRDAPKPISNRIAQKRYHSGRFVKDIV